MVQPRSRRAVPLLLALGAVLAVSCGDDEPDAGGSGSAGSTAEAVTTSASVSTSASVPASVSAEPDGAFPVTIEHKYGETVITEVPERIVVVGLTEQDALLALGVAPVGVTDWFGGHEFAVWPWAQPLLGSAEPVVLENVDGIEIEQVAALEPDVIIGLYSGITEDEYVNLSAIAPTVAQPGAYVDFGIPWQEATRAVGRIVGQAERADELVADVEARFVTAREEHPEFVGATAAAATPYEGVYVYGPEDVRGRFLADLGFVMPSDLTDLVVDEFGFELSLERLDLLDTDVIVWLDAEEARTPDGSFGSDLYENLAVHTEEREVFLDSESPDALGGATSFVTVLSLPYLLDGIVPMLAAAVDGDPATVVPGGG